MHLFYDEPLGLRVGYLLWTLALGAMGAAAFLAINSLALQSGTAVDIGDRGLIRIRTVVGAVFGFVLALPVSFHAFNSFIKTLLSVEIPPDNVALNLPNITQVLLPFFLGFSTSLVLRVLDRFVSAIEALFGVRSMGSANEPLPGHVAGPDVAKHRRTAQRFKVAPGGSRG